MAGGFPNEDPRKKPVYFAWDEEAFQSELGVRMMTPIQKWIYRTLLAAAFICSTRPFLPDDDDMLWFMAGCESKSQWLENKEAVLKMFFKEKMGGQRLLGQKRLVNDWNYLIKQRESAKESGRRGGLASAKARSSDR